MDFPTTGQVLLDGISTTELNDNGLTRLRREKVGFIFQSFQLLNTLTVLENVELPLLLAGETDTRDRALRQLELVELGGLTRGCRTSFPADRCSASPSLAPWFMARSCCWPMSPPATWIPDRQPDFAVAAPHRRRAADRDSDGDS